MKIKTVPCRESKSDISVTEAIIKRFSGFGSVVADGSVPLGYCDASMGNGSRHGEGTWCQQLQGSIGPTG